MLFGVGSGRWVALACAFVGLTLSLSDGVAAPRAAELGPTAPFAEPSGDFVGQLRVAPAHGSVGTPITVTGEGFPAGQDLDLEWATVTGSWKVSTAEYFGREYRPAAYRIATVKSDAAGRVAATFVAPDDFGFQHDVIIQQGSRLLTLYATQTASRDTVCRRMTIGEPSPALPRARCACATCSSRERPSSITLTTSAIAGSIGSP
jgi:hypothetical protein